MSEIDPVVVAKGLSEAQRKAFLDYTQTTWVPTIFVQLGLLEGCGHCGGIHRTPLGLAVKSILEKSHV